jgi:hypothetical protein
MGFVGWEDGISQKSASAKIYPTTLVLRQGSSDGPCSPDDLTSMCLSAPTCPQVGLDETLGSFSTPSRRGGKSGANAGFVPHSHSVRSPEVEARVGHIRAENGVTTPKIGSTLSKGYGI